MAFWSSRARTTPELVPMRSSVRPTKLNQFVALPRALLLELYVTDIICACTPAMNAPWVQEVVRDLTVYRYDTYDRYEGIDSVEKCLVAIHFFLQMLNGSFCFELIEEMGDGGELICRGLARGVIGARFAHCSCSRPPSAKNRWLCAVCECVPSMYA